MSQIKRKSWCYIIYFGGHLAHLAAELQAATLEWGAKLWEGHVTAKLHTRSLKTETLNP